MFPQLAIGALKTRRGFTAIGSLALASTDISGVATRSIFATGSITLGSTNISGVAFLNVISAYGEVTLDSASVYGLATRARPSSQLTYTPTELESYSYYGGSPLSAINNGNIYNGVIKVNGGTGDQLQVLLTFSTAVTLTSLVCYTGQFNGAYNQPNSADLYVGSTINPVNKIQTFSNLAYGNNGVSLPITASNSSSTFVIVFYNGTGEYNNISVNELILYGY